MGNRTYYYEFFKQRNQYSPGVYCTTDRLVPGMFDLADRVWRQGPRGGVKLMQEPWGVCDKFYGRGYVTTNTEAMKEFAWAKLKAKKFTN